MADNRHTPTIYSTEPERDATSSDRQRTRAQPKGYRVVAVSLYTPEADWIDEIALMLRCSGNPKANRSLVVREAILRLQEDLHHKDPAAVLRDFIDRQAKRGPPTGRKSLA
jgi:hypothetical protein